MGTPRPRLCPLCDFACTTQAVASMRALAVHKFEVVSSSAASEASMAGPAEEEDVPGRGHKRARASDDGSFVSSGASEGMLAAAHPAVATVSSEEAAFRAALARCEAMAGRFGKQAGDASHPFAFAFVEGLLVKVGSCSYVVRIETGFPILPCCSVACYVGGSCRVTFSWVCVWYCVSTGRKGWGLGATG